MSSNSRDDNRVPNISGVSDIGYTGNVEPAVNPIDHSMHVRNQEVVPTASVKNNPASTYFFDTSGNLIQIDQFIGSVTYRKTLNWTSGKLDVSNWTVV